MSLGVASNQPLGERPSVPRRGEKERESDEQPRIKVHTVSYEEKDDGDECSLHGDCEAASCDPKRRLAGRLQARRHRRHASIIRTGFNPLLG